MDEFKPEDELKPDPSDRRTGRSRQSSERSERTEPVSYTHLTLPTNSLV